MNITATYIRPEDVGAASEWSDEWVDFCRKFGYNEKNAPLVILLTEIKVQS